MANVYFNPDGTASQRDELPIFNDLSKAPKLNAVPTDFNVVVDTPSQVDDPDKPGQKMRMAAKLPSDVLLASTIQAVNAARQELVDEFAERDAQLAQQDTKLIQHDGILDAQVLAIQQLQTQMGQRIAELQAMNTALAAKKTLTLIGTATVPYTATVAISAGMAVKTATVNGIIAGEPILVNVVSLPLGFGFQGARASAANTVELTLQNPLLALGMNATLTFNIYANR